MKVVTDIKALRVPTEEVKPGENIDEVIETMLETWKYCEKNPPKFHGRNLMIVGLAANQCGLNKNVVMALLTPHAPEFIINPHITKEKGYQVGPEGCFSLPGVEVAVRRAQNIKVKGLNRYGYPVKWHLRGFKARIVIHEIDHLLGKLIIDYED